MPKVKISEYSSTANSNTDVASINIDEGCAPSGINNAIRAVMGHLKDFQTGAAGDAFNGATVGAHNGTVGATTPAAGTFTTLSATGNVTLGDAAADIVTVNGTTNFVVAPTVGGVGQNGFKNRIINGAMVINQRAFNGAVSSDTLTLDRYTSARSGGSATATVSQSSTVPAGFSNSLLYTVGTGAVPTGIDYSDIRQNIEGFNTADLSFGTVSASTVTLSFWVRCSLTGTFGVALQNSAFNRGYIASYVINSANTWEQKTVTIAGDTAGTWVGATNGTGLRVIWDLGYGPTYSTTAGSWVSSNLFGLTGGVKLASTSGATFYITGVQLEKGSTATSFDYRPYGTELALCQRYYQRGFKNILGSFEANNIAQFYTILPVVMRSAPTATFISGVSGSGGVYQVATNFPDIASIGTCSTTASAVQLRTNIGDTSGITTRAAVLNVDIFQLSSEL